MGSARCPRLKPRKTQFRRPQQCDVLCPPWLCPFFSKPIPQAYQWVPHSTHPSRESSWGPIQDVLLSYKISDSHHGGGAGVGATVPPSMKGLKVNVQARGALHWGLSTVTPHGLKFCYSTLFHTASLFHLPHFHRLLFYFTSSILTSLGGTFTAMPPNSPTLSFNLSGLFVEEGRDSNRGETRSKGIKQGGGRRLRKGIQREAANAKSHLRGHIEIYHCGSFLQYTHTWTISKWNHQITGRHLSTSSESSSARNGLHPIELLAKGVP